MKIKFCKDMHKILSKEFDTTDLVNHLKTCETCQKQVESIINEFIKTKPYGAMAFNIFKLLKQS